MTSLYCHPVAGSFTSQHCPICLELLGDNQQQIIAHPDAQKVLWHPGHLSCLGPWVVTHGTCPCCCTSVQLTEVMRKALLSPADEARAKYLDWGLKGMLTSGVMVWFSSGAMNDIDWGSFARSVHTISLVLVGFSWCFASIAALTGPTAEGTTESRSATPPRQ